MLEEFFLEADPDKLLAAGDPLPGPGPFTIYRGISGGGEERRERGFSWTLHKDLACWFAARLHLRAPAVLMARITAREVGAFLKGEDEIIAQPQKYERLKMTAAEIRQGAEAWVKRNKAKECSSDTVAQTEKRKPMPLTTEPEDYKCPILTGLAPKKNNGQEGPRTAVVTLHRDRAKNILGAVCLRRDICKAGRPGSGVTCPHPLSSLICMA